jgi:hypothetical protein
VWIARPIGVVREGCTSCTHKDVHQKRNIGNTGTKFSHSHHEDDAAETPRRATRVNAVFSLFIFGKKAGTNNIVLYLDAAWIPCSRIAR